MKELITVDDMGNEYVTFVDLTNQEWAVKVVHLKATGQIEIRAERNEKLYIHLMYEPKLLRIRLDGAMINPNGEGPVCIQQFGTAISLKFNQQGKVVVVLIGVLQLCQLYHFVSSIEERSPE